MKPKFSKRILFIAREFTLGGAAYLALRHMQRLILYYEIDLLITGEFDDVMLRQLPDQVNVIKLEDEETIYSQNYAKQLEFFLKYRKARVFQYKYCAVLATSVFPDWKACIALSLVRAPQKLVFLVDESLAAYHSPTDLHAFQVCLNATTLVIPVSKRLWQKIADKYSRILKLPYSVLHPPVDIEAIFSTSIDYVPHHKLRDRPVVVTVARLSKEKQILQCLHAHYRLKQSGIQFHWFVVGEGSEEGTIRKEIDKLDMMDDFFLTGNSKYGYDWMKYCDIFALLSSSEGCPTVIIEALLLHCPVLVTDVNGVDELIDNGRTGIIVSNNEPSIDDGLTKLVMDSNLREKLRLNLAATLPITNPLQETEWLVNKIEESTLHVSLDKPQVSIIIPTYNQEIYINRAIASALMQDFRSIEVIVLDDASTDRTEEIARNWSEYACFRYLRNEHNLGRVKNYQKGLECAQGEWVLLLDGDDHLSDMGFITLAWDALARYADNKPLFAQAGHRVCYLDNKLADVDVLPKIDAKEPLMEGSENLHFVYKTGFFSHLGTLYNRNAAIINQFYQKDISSSDMDSLLRLSLQGNVLILNTIAGCWIQHGNNCSSNLPVNKILENVSIFRKIAQEASQRGLLSMSKVNRELSRQEINTLIYLYSTSLKKTTKKKPFEIWIILISVNPYFFLNPRQMYYASTFLKVMIKMSIKLILKMEL